MPTSQKYTGVQTQGAASMGVGGSGMHMQVQGMQGGYGGQQGSNSRKYGAINVKGGLSSGLSVGPAAKAMGSIAADGQGSKYTSPYSQKYISNQRMSEIDN